MDTQITLQRFGVRQLAATFVARACSRLDVLRHGTRLDDQQAGPRESGSKLPHPEDRGIALILVMLALLVLSTLAASMIISARSETLASYNYKLNTQADYLAKAGIQQAVNWFRSGRYQPVLSSQSATYYSVTSDGSVFSLYTSDTAPVRCISNCSSLNSTVQLIGYGSGSSNYPSINDAGGTAVAAAFASDLVNVRVTGDASNSGTFSVNA